MPLTGPIHILLSRRNLLKGYRFITLTSPCSETVIGSPCHILWAKFWWEHRKQGEKQQIYKSLSFLQKGKKKYKTSFCVFLTKQCITSERKKKLMSYSPPIFGEPKETNHPWVLYKLIISRREEQLTIIKQKRCRYEKLPSASNPFIINRKNLRHQKEMWAKIHLIKISCQVLQSGAKNKCFISFHWPSDPGNISRRWCRLLLNNPWKNVLVGHLFNSLLLFLYFYL